MEHKKHNLTKQYKEKRTNIYDDPRLVEIYQVIDTITENETNYYLRQFSEIVWVNLYQLTRHTKSDHGYILRSRRKL